MIPDGTAPKKLCNTDLPALPSRNGSWEHNCNAGRAYYCVVILLIVFLGSIAQQLIDFQKASDIRVNSEVSNSTTQKHVNGMPPKQRDIIS